MPDSPDPLYMQLLVFTGGVEPAPLIAALQLAELDAVVYEDVHDPAALGLLTMSRDPAMFTRTLRPLLRREGLTAGASAGASSPSSASSASSGSSINAEMTMFGRTYLIGYETDQEEALVHRPRRHAFGTNWPWAVWYPLRRSGQFEQLPTDEQKKILREHGQIGRQFAEQDLAHDIRLAAHGLDRHDNDFVIGLTGKSLTPLSELIQSMRKTQQTSLYLERLGPFFVGRRIWKSR